MREAPAARPLAEGVDPCAEGGARPAPRRAWSVGSHLLLLLLVAVLALIGASAYGFVWSKAQLRSQALDYLEHAAGRAADDVTSSLDAVEQTVTAVQSGIDVEDLLARPEACALAAGGAGPFPAARIDILDSRGVVVCSSAPLPAAGQAPAATPEWLTKLLTADSPEVLQPVSDPSTGQPSLVVGAGLRADGAPVAAVAVFLPLDLLAGRLAADWGGPDEATFTVIDTAEGTVRSASVAPERAGTTVQGTGFEAGQESGTWTGLTDTERLFASADVPRTRWRVYAGRPDADVVAGARTQLLRESFVGAAALLLLGLTGWTVHRRITRPLRKVSRAVVAAAGDGSATQRVPATGPAEIAALAEHFNAMLDARAGHERELLEQALRDPLTGLPNRRLLQDRLRAALSDPDAGLVTVLFLDVDRFKLLNDSHGHEVGDSILVSVSSRLESALRVGDTLARFGGDEFVVLCQTVSTTDDAVALAARLHESLREPFSWQGTDVLLSASVGIAVGRSGQASADDLLREADTAMYRAKQAGSGWSLFDESLRRAARHRLDTELELNGAVCRGELRVHYQPILDLESGTVVGAEALVRWEHPERGLVPPAEFIPVAEETGQITRIGEHVLRQACEQAAAWNRSGHALRVSVNVAAAQLTGGDLHGTVTALLAETGIEPAQLCLEITESTLVRAAGPGSRTLERLAELGVSIAVDDFGTGYSSLSYLREFPVTELKVDRAFVSRLGASRRDDSLVEAIVKMAQALGLSVVAEGVETAAQRDVLDGLGCDLAQGYLFCRPGPAQAVSDLLRNGCPTSRSDAPGRRDLAPA